MLNRLLEVDDHRNRPQLFLWCLNSFLDLPDDRHSLWTTCGVSAIFWIFWMIGTSLCALGPVSSRQSSGFSGWSEPVSASLLALRYLPRLLYRLDGWNFVLCHNWEINEGYACGLEPV